MQKDRETKPTPAYLEILRKRAKDEAEKSRAMFKKAKNSRMKSDIRAFRASKCRTNKLCDDLLSAIEKTNDYAIGRIDLDGLNRESALKLVSKKLDELAKGGRLYIFPGKSHKSKGSFTLIRPYIRDLLKKRKVPCGACGYEGPIVAMIPSNRSKQ